MEGKRGARLVLSLHPSHMWWSSLMVREISKSRVSDSSLGARSSYTCSLSSLRNTPWSAASFQLHSVARMRKSRIFCHNVGPLAKGEQTFGSLLQLDGVVKHLL